MRGGRQTQKEQDLEGETYMVKMGGVGGEGGEEERDVPSCIQRAVSVHILKSK